MQTETDFSWDELCGADRAQAFAKCFFCDHLIATAEDATAEGKNYLCPTCVREERELAAEEAATAAFMASCSHPSIRIEHFDHVETETGYKANDNRATCNVCGANVEPEPVPAAVPEPERKPVQRAYAIAAIGNGLFVRVGNGKRRRR